MSSTTHDEAERLNLVLHRAAEAFVATDASGVVTDWNRAAEELLGFTRAQAIGRLLGDLVIPEALRDAHARGLRRFLETGEPGAVGRRVEPPALHADGHELPVELTISALRTPAGWTFHASLHDISARRAAAHQAELLAAIVEGSGDAILALDPAGTILSWNAAAEQLFGHREDEAVGRPIALLMLPGGDHELSVIARTVVDERRTYRAEVQRRHKDGHAVDVALTVSPLHDARGIVVGRSAIARDISVRRQHRERLARYTGELKARIGEDPQTGLPSRTELHATMADRVQGGTPFTLLLLGVDGLRERNAADGYAAGNRALAALGAAAAASVRDSDLVFRCSGATIAVVLAAGDPHDAAEVGRRIGQHLTATDPRLQLTVGTASWPLTARTPDELIRAARETIEEHRTGRADRSAPSATPRSALPSAAVVAIERLLATAAEQLGLDVAWLSELTEEEQVFRGVAGDAASFGLSRGGALPLDGSFCVRVLDGRLAPVIADTAQDAVARGLEVTREARIGAYAGTPVRLSDGRVYGMLCAASHEARPDLGLADERVLALLAKLVADRIQEEQLAAASHRSDVESTGIDALLAALDARDHYTGDHSQAVVELSGAVARELGLAADEVAAIEQVALLHDVGKVGIPDSVLQKAGPLDELEWDLMRQHSALGARIVAAIGSLAHLAPAVRAEHERWDGQGYPDGLRARDIPLASRVVLATDAFQAMTSDRPYRRALGRPAAIAELRAGAGSQFDPEVVAALVRVLEA